MQCAHVRVGGAFAPNRPSVLLSAVPDKHAAYRSKYTADRLIPGAFAGETITRRRFMTGTVHTAGAIAAAAFTLPALGFALGTPLFTTTPKRWEDVGSTTDFPDTTYVARDQHDRFIPGKLTVRSPSKDSITEFDGARIEQGMQFTDRDFTPEAIAK